MIIPKHSHKWMHWLRSYESRYLEQRNDYKEKLKNTNRLFVCQQAKNKKTRLRLQCKTPVQRAFSSESLFSPSKGSLKLKFIYHWRSSSIEGHLLSKVVFHQRLSSIYSHFQSQVIIHVRSPHNQRLSAIKGCLLWKVIFNWRSSSIEAHLPLKVVFHW